MFNRSSSEICCLYTERPIDEVSRDFIGLRTSNVSPNIKVDDKLYQERRMRLLNEIQFIINPDTNVEKKDYVL